MLGDLWRYPIEDAFHCRWGSQVLPAHARLRPIVSTCLQWRRGGTFVGAGQGDGTNWSAPQPLSRQTGRSPARRGLRCVLGGQAHAEIFGLRRFPETRCGGVGTVRHGTTGPGPARCVCFHLPYGEG